MAGEWLKMRHDLADDPAVIRLADIVQLDDDAVIGKVPEELHIRRRFI
jgi:hypothetical protein